MIHELAEISIVNIFMQLNYGCFPLHFKSFCNESSWSGKYLGTMKKWWE